jgi:hypothetical protein
MKRDRKLITLKANKMDCSPNGKRSFTLIEAKAACENAGSNTKIKYIIDYYKCYCGNYHLTKMRFGGNPILKDQEENKWQDFEDKFNH